MERTTNIPKDFKDYENYCYELAKRYDIDTFELENETQFRCDPEIQAHYLSAAYKGIKRAKPDAVIIGGSMGCARAKYCDWLRKQLEFAKKEKLGRLYDVFAPHYILDHQAPEYGVHNLKRAKELAKDYGFKVWNGENGEHLSFRGFMPNAEFLDIEKKFVNLLIRQYIIHKSEGIGAVVSCWGMEYTLPEQLDGWEIHFIQDSNGDRFYGTGAFLKPWGVAHAVMACLFDGSEFKMRVDREFNDFYCMVFERGKETVAALWMKKGEAEITIDLPRKTVVRNIVGTPEIVSGRKSFAITEEPIYLVAKDISYKKLVKALQSAKFEPAEVITVKDILFNRKENALEIIVKNNCSKRIGLDEIEIGYEGKLYKLENIRLAGEEESKVSCKLAEDIDHNLFVKLNIKTGGRVFKTEQFVLYPSVECAKKQGYLIALKTEKPIKIDGVLGEWTDAVSIVLNNESQVIFNPRFDKAQNLWKGPDDLSAVGYVMYDNENLYFACKVTDDVYRNPFDSSLEYRMSSWNCDSIQIGIDPKMDSVDRYGPDDQEINLSLSEKGPVIYNRFFGAITENLAIEAGKIPGAELAVKKWDKGLTYEARFPIRELTLGSIKNGKKAKFNFIVNDDDGVGRRMWIGITPGIGEKKAPNLYETVIFLE